MKLRYIALLGAVIRLVGGMLAGLVFVKSFQLDHHLAYTTLVALGLAFLGGLVTGLE